VAQGPHPNAYSLPGARLIHPLTQGDSDGLCGLYCLINAIRIVTAPHRELKRKDIRMLFTAGVRFLARRGSLPEAVHSCVGEREWPKLARHLVKLAQETCGRPILLERAKLLKGAGFDETSRDLTRIIASGAAPCVFLRGKTRHYTVISGYTPLSFRLFDSFGYHRVLRRSCGTRGAPGLRHHFHLRSIISLRAP
jgi:hypothetical protein